MSQDKRKRSSTGSELDTSLTQDNSTYTLDNITEKESQSTEKTKKKSKSSKKAKLQKPVDKEQRTMAEFLTEKSNPDRIELNISKKLDEIDEKLKCVLTKSDKSFIKQIIQDTVEEMKDKIISSVVRRIEILEGEIHEMATENKKLTEELANQRKENEKFSEQYNKLQNQVIIENESLKEALNDAQQYSRANNVRVNGIINDRENQSADEATNAVIKIFNKHMNMDLSVDDIDIAHRIGPYKDGKNRPIIVKFLQRRTKFEVIKRIPSLIKAKTGIYINEDLTPLNNEVLSSLRLKAKDRIAGCWSVQGKIYAKFITEKGQNGEPDKYNTERIRYKDFNTWLKLPWPKKQTLSEPQVKK